MTRVDLSRRQVHALMQLSPRRFATQLTALICDRLLEASFGCQKWQLEVEGCDVLMQGCTKEPLAPNSCLESKYVENYWLRRGTLLQTLKDAVAKLRRAMPKRPVRRLVLLSSFAQQKPHPTRDLRSRGDDNLFKTREQHVLVVVLLSSEIGEKKLQNVVEVISQETEEYLKAEGLEAITNIGANIIYDELQEVKQEQWIIREEQQAIREEQRAIREEQRAIREEQQATKQHLIKLERLLNQILEKLDEN